MGGIGFGSIGGLGGGSGSMGNSGGGIGSDSNNNNGSGSGTGNSSTGSSGSNLNNNSGNTGGMSGGYMVGVADPEIPKEIIELFITFSKQCSSTVQMLSLIINSLIHCLKVY